tara:strand:+ start:169 stop:600 length:432 start_codon:yes stop_codon:yes gene_type:complete
MNILGFQSSGDQTSVSIMIGEEINSFNYSHNRKDRPNWDMFLENIGIKNQIQLQDIDIFAFADCQGSYTATRTIASYLKGMAIALEKPLIAIEDNNKIPINSSDAVKLAKEKFLNANSKVEQFHPNLVNPSYSLDTKYKKIND